MRYEIAVTWIKNSGTEVRSTPPFTIEADDEADARSIATSILNYPLNAYVDVKPTQRVEIAGTSLAALQGVCAEALASTRAALDDLIDASGGNPALRRRKPICERQRLVETLANLNDVLRLTTTLHATLRAEPMSAKKRKTA